MTSEQRPRRRRYVLIASTLLALMILGLAYGFWPREEAGLSIRTADGDTIRISGQLADPMSQGPMHDYFEAKTDAEKLAVLDAVIEQQETMLQGINLQSGENLSEADADELARRAAQAAGAPVDKAQAVRLKMGEGAMARSVKPADQARISEFAKALADRRKEKGLDPNAPLIITRRGPGG